MRRGRAAKWREKGNLAEEWNVRCAGLSIQKTARGCLAVLGIGIKSRCLAGKPSSGAAQFCAEQGMGSGDPHYGQVCVGEVYGLCGGIVDGEGSGARRGVKHSSAHASRRCGARGVRGGGVGHRNARRIQLYSQAVARRVCAACTVADEVYACRHRNSVVGERQRRSCGRAALHKRNDCCRFHRLRAVRRVQ